MPFQPPGVDEIEQEQPKFTPPPVDDVDWTANIRLTPYDKYRLALAHGATPENYSELGIPASLNPDYDIVREAGPVPFVSGALKALNDKVIEPVAAQVLTQMRRGTAGETALLNKGKANISEIEPGKPMLQLPRLSPEEMQGATPTEKIAAGIGEGAAQTIEGFSTPGSILTMPFAEFKPVQAYYGAQMAASIPDSIKALDDAKTPDEKARAYTALTANLGMGALMAHSLTTKGRPDASKIKEATEVHGDVRPQPEQSAGPLPQQEGGGRVFTPPKPTEAQVPLNEEHQTLLDPHMADGRGVFTTLEDGRVMRANHETGQVEVDPEEFRKWVDQDLKDLSPSEKKAAVASAFEHEDIHLKTDPEDAEPFWNSLSPFEQYVLKRQYLKGRGGELPQNLGFEAIRNRVEQAMGMTRSDFVGLALHEKWTAHALDMLANIVGKIRRFRDKELSAHQKLILDKVTDNITAARNAVPASTAVDQPFMRRQEDEPAGPPPSEKVAEFLKRAPGETTPKDVLAMDDEDTRQYFDGIRKQGNAVQNDAVLAGMRMSPGDIPELTRLRDEMHRTAMRRLEENIKTGNPQTPSEFGKVIWLNGALEGAARKGPNYESVVTRRREGGPAMLRRKSGVPENDPRRKFYDFSYYEDRLQQPELLKESIPVAGGPDEGGLLAVPVGGERKSGSLGCAELFDKQHASEIAEQLRGKKGFPDVRVVRMPRGYEEFPDMRYQVEWGAPIDWETGWDEIMGPNQEYHDRLGDQFGYYQENDPRTTSGRRLEDFPLSNHQGVQKSLFPDMPAMRRKKGKAGDQEEMFGPVTRLGVPGGEDVQPTSAGEMGAVTLKPEQKVFAQDVYFENPSESENAQLPYRPISPSEAKNPTELKKILTSEARIGGSDLPVSMTRRLTALFDKRDGTVHLVSTYPGDGTVRMVDPGLAGKERPSRPVEELLHNYEPFYSILLREPKQNFHQKFNTMADFQEMFHKEASDLARQYGTGYSGIPQGGDVTSVDAPGVREADVPQKGLRLTTPFQFPGEKYDLPRPLEPELRAFHDFFGDTPPSDAQQWARRIERTAATASRAMISGLRKLVRIMRANNRGLSEGDALGRVLDQLYDNYKNSETRSDFVQRTMEQGRPSTAEADASARRLLLAQAEREKRSGARNLSTLRSKAPTTVEGFQPAANPNQGAIRVSPEGRAMLPGTGPSELGSTPPEMLSPEDYAALQNRIEKEAEALTQSRSAELMKSIVDSPTPKERYRVSGSNKPVESLADKEEAHEGADALEEEEIERQESKDKEIGDYINRELFPERDVASEAPAKPAGESLAQEKKVVAKGEGRKGQLDFFKQEGPAMRRRVQEVQEETAKAVGALTAYVKRKASEQELAATRDAVDTKYAIAGDQADKAIRLVTADKTMKSGKPEVLKAAPTVVQAGAYTVDFPIPEELKGEVLSRMEKDPIYRNIENMFASNDPIDKAKGGQMLAKLKRDTVLQMVDEGEIDWRTGTLKFNKKAVDQLDKFSTKLDLAEARSKAILEQSGGGLQGLLDRRAARARLKAVGQMREQLNYAKEHWNEPELQDTAAKMVMELEQQHRLEREQGIRVKRAENYLPGRYDEQWFDGDRIHFMEGPRILGRNFRKPATFDNYYDAIAAGNYLPFNMDGASLVGHRVRQGMRQVETRLWEKSLKSLRDPHSGKPMVADPVRRADGSYTGPSPEYQLVDFGNRYMAVHKGSVDIIKSLVGDSIIRDVPATRRAMQFSQKLKHTILFLDTFHLGRLKAYDWSINGIGKGGYKGGLSILEYRPEDVAGAVSRGLVSPEEAAWADEKVNVNLPRGQAEVSRRDIANMFINRGLNVGRIADSIYKVEGMGWIGKYNRWLFDKMTRGLMLETAVKEFERLNGENPKVDYRKLVDDISRDTNNYMGSIGRQGWIKNQTFQDIFRMFGLAPQWVEGLVKKETALPGRLSGLSYLAGRRNVPLLGTAGRGIARGLATMFLVTQAMNLITRRQPTWKNEEEGHKWDAWIPDVTGKSEGFFMSPLSLFNEVTHDIIRLTGNKPTVYDALHQIGENKLGPYGRAAMVLATGETPTHRKITSTAGEVKEVGKALLPIPISLGKMGQAGLAMAGIGKPPAPGSVQRQMMASLGVKTEPAPTANNQIYKKAEDFVKANGLQRSSGWQQVQTDELGYTDLRRAAATGDAKAFGQALEKLRESRTDDQIYKSMKLWNARSFTGSKAMERYFLADLTDKELDLYERAKLERQQTFNNFENLLVDDLEKKSAPAK